MSDAKTKEGLFERVRKIRDQKSRLQASEEFFKHFEELEKLHRLAYMALYYDERGQGIGYDTAMRKLKEHMRLFL